MDGVVVAGSDSQVAERSPRDRVYLVVSEPYAILPISLRGSGIAAALWLLRSRVVCSEFTALPLDHHHHKENKHDRSHFQRHHYNRRDNRGRRPQDRTFCPGPDPWAPA